MSYSNALFLFQAHFATLPILIEFASSFVMSSQDWEVEVDVGNGNIGTFRRYQVKIVQQQYATDTTFLD